MINNYFLETYLTCGGSRGKFVFKNCPDWLMKMAESQFKKRQGEIVPHIIRISSDVTEKLRQARDSVSNDIQKKIIARNYVNSLVMKSLVEGDNSDGVYDYTIGYLDTLLAIMENPNKGDLIHFITTCPMTYEVEKFMRTNKNLEVIFILDNMQDSEVMRAINTYLSAGGMNIKVFANREFATHLNEADVMVVSPHDYQTIYFEHYLESQDDGEMV